MNAFFAGLSLGFSLILAIGSQNAFVLKQGLRKEYIFIVALICALSDAILISIGVYSFTEIIIRMPIIEPIARYGGSLFLIIYGSMNFWSAFKNNASLIPSEHKKASLLVVVSTSLALTWLNPHVYLDTVMLLGSISTQYANHELEFTIGAVLSSFIFFFALAYGARILIPIFKKPKSWKILDFIIGIIMFWIAFSLINI